MITMFPIINNLDETKREDFCPIIVGSIQRIKMYFNYLTGLPHCC